MNVTRRDFLASVPAAPFVKVPEIPCHDWKIVEKGEFCMVHLVASRRRKAPLVEIEEWTKNMNECAVCGEVWLSDRKKRVRWCAGDWMMNVPPVVPYPGVVIVVLNTTCKIWVDGVEIDWMSVESDVDAFSSIAHKYMDLP